METEDQSKLIHYASARVCELRIFRIGCNCGYDIISFKEYDLKELQKELRSSKGFGMKCQTQKFEDLKYCSECGSPL